MKLTCMPGANSRQRGWCVTQLSHCQSADFGLCGAPRRLVLAARPLGLACALLVFASTVCAETETIRVDLKLRTGGALGGLVVDHTEHGLVIVHEDTPYVFAWSELEAGCAYATKRALLILQRGDKTHLSAEDHYQLGLFALRHARSNSAANEFRMARKLGSGYGPMIEQALREHRRDKAAASDDAHPLTQDPSDTSSDAADESSLPRRIEDELTRMDGARLAPQPSAEHRAQVLEVYRAFGKKVQEVMGRGVVLIESDHFLIWTDWEARHRERLEDWCESMYSALCAQFDLDPAVDVFLAKCPVFAWRQEKRFKEFARLFDGYASTNAIGYTRSIEKNGHVHVVVLRQGRLEADFDRFACTLVHEGTHAFMHRLYTSRLIPHWINEGYAELMAERVLGERCPAGEKAALLARQFVRYDWPIAGLLHGTGPIDVHQYPLAHSVVSHLEGADRRRFASFIKDLKGGATVEAALAANYDGMTIDQLEARWRSAVKAGGARFKVHRDVPGITYRNVCGSAGQWPILEQNGQGIGIIDYDGDGLVDLFVPNGSTESRWRRGDNPGCRLFKNLGDWRFTDVTDEAGVRGNAWSCGVAVADYDADGDFDVYVLNWGTNVLYRNNGDSTFTDVTKSAGVGDARWSSSAAFADFDGDGRLDIYVSNYVHFDYDAYPTREKDGKPCLYRNIKTGCGPWCYEGVRDTLYVNTGSGHFEDRSVAAGLKCTEGFRGFGVVAADLDNDRDVDVYVGCDVMPNLYLENTGNGHFVSVGSTRGGAYNAAGGHESGMGVAVADFDNSGTLDLFVTNFSAEKNTFYRNEDGLLSDDSSLIRLDRHRMQMGWGVCARDFNQDGLVDVFMTNGHIYPQVSALNDPADQYAQPPRLYTQNDRGRLNEIETARAFGQRVAMSLRGCATADFDNDGDWDVVAVEHNGGLVFFENLSNRPALLVELVDARGGLSPMGARVGLVWDEPSGPKKRRSGFARRNVIQSADVGPSPTYRVLPNQGYQSSNDHRIAIPLPNGATGVQVDVVWPNGSKQRYNLKPRSRGVIRLQQGNQD